LVIAFKRIFCVNNETKLVLQKLPRFDLIENFEEDNSKKYLVK